MSSNTSQTIFITKSVAKTLVLGNWREISNLNRRETNKKLGIKGKTRYFMEAGYRKDAGTNPDVRYIDYHGEENDIWGDVAVYCPGRVTEEEDAGRLAF